SYKVVRIRYSFPRSSQNQRDLPRDIPLVSVEVLSRHGPSDAMHNSPQPLKGKKWHLAVLEVLCVGEIFVVDENVRWRKEEKTRNGRNYQWGRWDSGNWNSRSEKGLGRGRLAVGPVFGPSQLGRVRSASMDEKLAPKYTFSISKPALGGCRKGSKKGSFKGRDLKKELDDMEYEDDASEDLEVKDEDVEVRDDVNGDKKGYASMGTGRDDGIKENRGSDDRGIEKGSGIKGSKDVYQANEKENVVSSVSQGNAARNVEKIEKLVANISKVSDEIHVPFHENVILNHLNVAESNVDRNQSNGSMGSGTNGGDTEMFDSVNGKRPMSFISTIQGMNANGNNKLSRILVMVNEKGKNVVDMDPVLEEGSNKWDLTLVGYFARLKMSYGEILEHLRRMWRSHQFAEVITNECGLYFLKFRSVKEEIRLTNFCQQEVKPILHELHLNFEIFQNRFKRDIKEMKDVFVSTENDLDETLKQNESLKDRLLEVTLAEDIKNLIITSCVEIGNKNLQDKIKRILKEPKNVSNEIKTVDTFCNDAFDVTQELSKRIVDMEKYLSKLEAHSIAFEIALQHKSQENNSLKKLKKENKNFLASLQIENAHLKQTYKDLLETVQRSRVETNPCDVVKVKVDFDETETKNIELEHQVASLLKENEHLKLVDDSKAEKDQLLKEINHLRTQLENLKGKSVEIKFDKPLILGKPPSDKLLINSQISKSWFTPKVVVQKDLLKPVTAQSLSKNEKDQLLKRIASLESKLASQDIRSCQKEYYELRTAYNALKVKFDSLNRTKRKNNVFNSSKPKVGVLEKVHTGESSKSFSKRVS
ncbi:hypothetical protein Tco_0556954, partial [Tanacetum coccineum]